jgi:hypothetical protein
MGKGKDRFDDGSFNKNSLWTCWRFGMIFMESFTTESENVGWILRGEIVPWKLMRLDDMKVEEEPS